MSENQTHTDLVQKMVTDHDADIKEAQRDISRIKEDISTLKTDHKITSINVQHVMDSVTGLKQDFINMDSKVEGNIKELRDDINSGNDRVVRSQLKQADQYKSTLWRVGGSIIGSVIVALILFSLGIA